MPLAHRPLLRAELGMSDAEERKARGEHILVASGCCGLLHLLLPGLVPSSSATVSPWTMDLARRLLDTRARAPPSSHIHTLTAGNVRVMGQVMSGNGE